MQFQQEGKAVRGISFPDYDEPSSALVRMYLDGELGDSATAVSYTHLTKIYNVNCAKITTVVHSAEIY